MSDAQPPERISSGRPFTVNVRRPAPSRPDFTSRTPNVVAAVSDCAPATVAVSAAR